MSVLLDRVRHPLRQDSGAFDRRLIPPMIVGAVLNPVNTSIIAVSLVPIGAAFGAPPSQTAWLVSGLYLATAIGQPVVGRLVDAYGPRPLFLAGAILVVLAGAVGALAPSLGVLVAARIILGFGTCAGYPAAMRIIRGESQRTGEDSPAGILTALAVSTQTIVVIGPTLGGLLIGLGGWRTTLAVNIPLGLLSFWLGWRRLPRTARDADADRPMVGLDPAGIGLFAGTLVAVLLFLMTPRRADAWLLVVAAAGAAALVWRELRAAVPCIDVRVLAGNLPLLATYLRGLLAQLVAYSFLYGFTQWLEDSRRLTATQAGLVLLPVFGVAIIVSTTTGRRPEIRMKLLVGAATQVIVCALLLLTHPTTAIWLLVGIAVLLGIPQGLNNLAVQNALYYQADPERIASSAGLLRTFSYLGAIGASAAIGLFFGAAASTRGLHELATFMLIAGALFGLLTVADRSLRHVVRPIAHE